MANRKKLLIAGDFTNPIGHPFGNISVALGALVTPQFDVVCNEHYESIALTGYQDYCGVLFYTEHWTDKSQTVPEMLPALIRYVAHGGGLICLHCLDLAYDDESAQMIGARGTGNYIRADWSFTPCVHSITNGISKFQMADELELVEFHPLSNTETLLLATYRGSVIPVAWCSEFGLGRIVTLLPGHARETFDSNAFRKLLRQSIEWAVGFR